MSLIMENRTDVASRPGRTKVERHAPDTQRRARHVAPAGDGSPGGCLPGRMPGCRHDTRRLDSAIGADLQFERKSALSEFGDAWRFGRRAVQKFGIHRGICDIRRGHRIRWNGERDQPHGVPRSRTRHAINHGCTTVIRAGTEVPTPRNCGRYMSSTSGGGAV